MREVKSQRRSESGLDQIIFKICVIRSSLTSGYEAQTKRNGIQLQGYEMVGLVR